MRISPGAIAAGSALTVATVLAGCGGSQAPAADITAIDRPSVTTSSAAAPSSSATEAVSLDSDAAVEVAARAYVAALSATFDEVDLAPLEATTTTDCMCRTGIIEGVSKLKANSWHENGQTSLREYHLQARQGDKAETIVSVEGRAYGVLDASNQTVRAYPSYSQKLELSLRVEGDQWRVWAVRILS